MRGYSISTGTVLEEEKMLAISAECDVVVVGGGPAGMMAAIGASRLGAKVALVENNSYLGGVATGAMMTALVHSQYATGLALELMDNLASEGGAPKWDSDRTENMTTPFDAEVFKRVALEMVLHDGVDLKLYTQACEPIVEDGEIRGVVTESKSGRSAVLGRIVVDCTGDADLAYRSGAPCEVGRSSDSRMRPFALLFRLGGLDVEKVVQYVKENPDELQPQHTKGTHLLAGGEKVITRISGFYKLVEKAKKRGELYPECHYLRFEALWVKKGIALCNTTRIYGVDGTDARDLTRGEIEGRRQIQRLVSFIKQHVPGGENAFLLDVAPRMGVRETRRIVGEYYLTDEDAYADAKFDDAVMSLDEPLIRRPIPPSLDVHIADPIEGSEIDSFERYPERVQFERHAFQVPYRVLLPRKIDNLLVAGRSISVSHVIDGITRDMIPCMRMGQVAGVAAAMAAKQRISLKQLAFKDIRPRLIEQRVAI